VLVLKGHGTAVVGAIFSTDGSRLVTTSENGMVRVWDAPTGGEIAVLGDARLPDRPSTGEVTTIGLGGRRILHVDRGALRLWDVESGREIDRVDEGVIRATFSEDGRTYVIAPWNGEPMRICDAETGAELHQWEPLVNTVIQDACFSRDGKLLASNGPDCSVFIRDVKSGKILHRMEHE
jgi:WD40 repeat protein